MADVAWTVESCLYPVRGITGSFEVLLGLSRTGSSAGKWVPIGSPVPSTSGIREHVERDLAKRMLRDASIRIAGLVTELAPHWRETLILYTAHGSWSLTPPPDEFATQYRWISLEEFPRLTMPQADSRFNYRFLSQPGWTYEATMRFDADGMLQHVRTVGS